MYNGITIWAYNTNEGYFRDAILNTIQDVDLKYHIDLMIDSINKHRNSFFRESDNACLFLVSNREMYIDFIYMLYKRMKANTLSNMSLENILLIIQMLNKFKSKYGELHGLNIQDMKKLMVELITLIPILWDKYNLGDNTYSENYLVLSLLLSVIRHPSVLMLDITDNVMVKIYEKILNFHIGEFGFNQPDINIITKNFIMKYLDNDIDNLDVDIIGYKLISNTDSLYLNYILFKLNDVEETRHYLYTSMNNGEVIREINTGRKSYISGHLLNSIESLLFRKDNDYTYKMWDIFISLAFEYVKDSIILEKILGEQDE